ncbi:hypothetical protein CEXT_180851 [Caerostris extrusa]|uniref:Uncharacterized protein n=1 Tax=Caerostris extrusa TaxID=172846 RepID=A0AAV4XAA6_CAEEX|nr:hypothetical protein CEXT_180851 [Caerostris extrusa]
MEKYIGVLDTVTTTDKIQGKNFGSSLVDRSGYWDLCVSFGHTRNLKGQERLSVSALVTIETSTLRANDVRIGSTPRQKLTNAKSIEDFSPMLGKHGILSLNPIISYFDAKTTLFLEPDPELTSQTTAVPRFRGPRDIKFIPGTGAPG